MLAKKLMILAILSMTISPNLKAAGTQNVIYGIDDRREINQIPQKWIKKQANSVAMMVLNNRLKSIDDNYFTYRAVNLGQALNLCQDTPFIAQPALGNCSGFLAAPNKIVTAGHCVTNQSDCDNYSWVFNFNSENNGKIKKSQVFKCKSIIQNISEKTSNHIKDYAIIELDGEVTNARPLEFRKKGKVLSTTKLYVLGHPDGIPMKYSDDAKVLSFIKFNFSVGPDFGLEKTELFNFRKDVFLTNLDTFSGNSGSPVFNKKTGIVEGILIEGENDYEFDMNQGCNNPYQTVQKPFHEGEVVQRIRAIPKELLK